MRRRAASARRRLKAAREAYSLYVERAAEGASDACYFMSVYLTSQRYVLYSPTKNGWSAGANSFW